MADKGKLVEERGGRCQHCGYSSFPQILRFVQVSPILGQRRSLGKIISDGSEDKAREAANHAILTCPNCAEIYKLGYFDICFRPSEPPKIFDAAEIVSEEEELPEMRPANES